MLTDPIADMLTRLRNQSAVGHEKFTVSYSKIKKSILDLLVTAGFVESVEVVQEGAFPELNVKLFPNKKLHVRRVSKPGQRIYIKSEGILKVRNGLGISIISTSKGVMTSFQARKEKVGGEIVCEIY